MFDPKTDPRNLFHEIEQEILDSINYLAFQVLKLRATKEKYERIDKNPVG